MGLNGVIVFQFLEFSVVVPLFLWQAGQRAALLGGGGFFKTKPCEECVGICTLFLGTLSFGAVCAQLLLG